ncbi:MAG: type II secretion system F family protein [Conexivisphaerales archaeon]
MQKAKLKKVKKRQKEERDSLDAISTTAYRIFRGPATSIAKKMPSMREELLKSNMRLTPEALISLALFLTMITGIISAVLVILALLLRFLYLFMAVVIPPIVFIVLVMSPKMSQSSRAYALENELPYVMGFMQVLAGGGVSPIIALKRISGMSKVFPAASKEAKRILIDIEVFGKDPITALTNAARTNPNRDFAEFLYGYATILKTGGDVGNYVHIKMRELFDKRNMKLKRSADTIGTLAESYVTVTSVLGISLFMLYEVQSVISHNQAGLQSIFLFAFVIVPLISAVFIWLLDSMQPKQPYIDYRPFKAFAVSGVIGAALFLIPLPLKLYLHVSIALAAMVSYPAILSMKYARERTSIENALPDFIRDVAEGRKIGLSPEMSIEQLVNKGYGLLSSPVRKMGSQLSWGLSLDKVMKSFVNQVNSWLAKVVGTLMLEVVDAGGGMVQSFSELADFTRKVQEFENDLKASLRPYIMVIYMAGLMIVITTFLMVYLMTQPAISSYGASSLGGAVSPTVIEELLVATIFESWVVGFVAGKMGSGSLANGFIHAFILVIAGALTIILSGFFIHIPL